MSKITALTARFWRFLGTPFRAIVTLNRQQVRSLVTVGFLAGMISLSAENWALTFYIDNAVFRENVINEEFTMFVGFLADRMRNTSVLQGIITLTLGAVVLNADRVSLQAGAIKTTT